jgi:hypothetical protein
MSYEKAIAKGAEHPQPWHIRKINVLRRLPKLLPVLVASALSKWAN